MPSGFFFAAVFVEAEEPFELVAGDTGAFSVAMRECEGDDVVESSGPSAGRRGALGLGGGGSSLARAEEEAEASESVVVDRVGGAIGGSALGLVLSGGKAESEEGADDPGVAVSGVEDSGGGSGFRFLWKGKDELFSRRLGGRTWLTCTVW